MYFSETSSETSVLEMNAMDQSLNENNQGNHWYEDFIANYDYQSPKTGQVLEGTIIRIDDDALLVDVGMKRDAVVPSRDLSQVDEAVLSNLEIGDQVLVYVISSPVGDRDLLVSLNKGIEHRNWERAEKYLQEGTILDLEIIGHNRGGLIVKFETLRGFLPYSQVPELRQARDPKLIDKIKREAMGSSMEMKVIEVVRHRNRLIFSAWAAKAEKRRRRLQELEKEQIIHGRVTSVVDFGIFVDLDGVDGLVHISQLDWTRVKHPSELFKVGDEIDVKVLNEDVERERVSLSRKALLPSPWQEVAETLSLGECIEGRVTKVVDFGAFVELSPGVEGLVHNSQLGYSASQDSKSVVRSGESVLVRILNIDPDRERISLSMRQVPLERQIAWAVEHLDKEDKGGKEIVESVGSQETGSKTSEPDVDSPEKAETTANEADTDSLEEASLLPKAQDADSPEEAETTTDELDVDPSEEANSPPSVHGADSGEENETTTNEVEAN